MAVKKSTASKKVSSRKGVRTPTEAVGRVDPAQDLQKSLLDVQHRLWMCMNIMDLICRATDDDSDLTIWGSATLASKETYRLAVELGDLADGLKVPHLESIKLAAARSAA